MRLFASIILCFAGYVCTAADTPYLLPPGRIKAPYMGRGYLLPRSNPARARLVFSASSLPKGLLLSKDGHLHGKPEQAGDFSFRVHVSVESGQALDQPYQIHIDGFDVKLLPPSAPPQVALLPPGSPAVTSAPAPSSTAAPPATPGFVLPVIRGPLQPGMTQFCVNATASTSGATPANSPQIKVIVNDSPVGLKDSNGNLLPFVTTDANGQACPILEPTLIAGDTVSVHEHLAGVQDGDSPTVNVTDPFDLGRIRYYFTSGVVVSNNQGFQFQSSGTQAGMFLGLDADRAWIITNRRGWNHFGLNTFFDARLTSVPTQGSTTTTTMQTGTMTTQSSSLSSFLQSQKAGSLGVGAYLPFVTAEWTAGTTPYSFFVAPLAKAGFITLTDQQTPPTTTANGTASVTTAVPLTGRFFTSYAFGARLGVFRTYKTSAYDWDTDAAPELISYVDIATGRFGNFEAFRDLTVERAQMAGMASPLPAATDELFRQRPYRYSFEGLLKIPHSVFVVGFSANIGRGSLHATKIGNLEFPFTQPRDDLRFLFGAQFDFTKFLKAIPTF